MDQQHGSPRRRKLTAPVSDGRGAPGGNRGGTGAPPSNTAPDNSIEPVVFQPLRWGIDSLYLSYPGELDPSAEATLRRLKAKAQGPEHEAAEAQLQLGSHIFEVKDKSSGLFAFALVDNAFMIRLSASRSKTLPMAYVQVSSGLLAYRDPASIEAELRALLAELGSVEAPKVSRVDLYVDFASTLDMESWKREAWVTRASAVSQYAEDATFTGWAIGAGGVLMARLYNKLIECKKRGKEYLLGLWTEAGWNGAHPVWRLEFEFRREILAQLGLDSLNAVLDHRNGLWSYGTTDWLKLCEPNPQDQTRSRWAIQPLWMDVADIDWESPGGPLLRSYSPSRAPSREYLGSRALALLASMGAVANLPDFQDASVELLHEASNALGRRYGLSGISLEQGFTEMVAANNRRFNVKLNDPGDPEAEPDDPKLQNPYYRAKQGL